MTPAVPDPTVEALSEAEVQLLREALGTMPGSYVNPVAEVVTRILAEHTERAAREALEAAAVRVEAETEHPASHCCKGCDGLRKAARIVREGGADHERDT